METTITVKDNNPINLQSRVKSLEKINELSTKTLKNIEILASNKKAIDYLTDDKKFARLQIIL